jgi:hypothetical protein
VQEGFQGFDLVTNPGQVEDLRTEFDASSFDKLFQQGHEDSGVSVAFLVNNIFIIRMFMEDYKSVAEPEKKLRRIL